MDTPEYVGSKIFDKIVSDTRVTEDLSECLYCFVMTSNSGDIHSENEKSKRLPYKIPLNNTSHFAKQCPACLRIYILKDPI